MSYWHHAGEAKMGRDPLPVVDCSPKVYGVEHLRFTDGSVMPRSTPKTGWRPEGSSPIARQKK